MAVGDNQGNVYRGREGTGQAYRLMGDPDIKYIEQPIAEAKKNKAIAQAKNERAAAQKKATRQAAKKAMEVQPEWFWAHQQEMQGRLDKVMDLGAQIMSAGVDDPFSATDEASIKFQKELANLNLMQKLSMQIKDRYNKDREKILADKDNKFTIDSKDALEDWYRNNSLEKISKDGILPPNLRYNTPKMNVEKTNREMAKGIDDDAPLRNFVEVALGTGGTNQEYFDNHKQLYDEMPQDAKDQLKAEAASLGVTTDEGMPMFLAAKWMKSYKGGDKPFDIAKATKGLDIGLVTRKWAKEEGNRMKSGMTQELPIKKAMQASLAWADANPWEVEKMINKGLSYNVYEYDKNGNFEFVERKVVEDREDAAEMVAMHKLLTAPRQTSYKDDITFRNEMERKFGIGDDEMLEDFDLWWEALQGNLGDNDQEKKLNQDRAASFLKGTKYRNYEISDARIKLGDAMPRSLPGQLPLTGLQIEGVMKGTGDMKNRNVSSGPMDIMFGDQENWNSGSAQELYRATVKKRGSLFKPTTEVGSVYNMGKVGQNENDYRPPSDDNFTPPTEEDKEEIETPKGFN